jgi:hypothetical protein
VANTDYLPVNNPTFTGTMTGGTYNGAIGYGVSGTNSTILASETWSNIAIVQIIAGYNTHVIRIAHDFYGEQSSSAIDLTVTCNSASGSNVATVTASGMGNNADVYYSMATSGFVSIYLHKWNGNAIGINSATIIQSTYPALVSIYNSFTPSTTLPTGAVVAPGIYSRNGLTVVQNALQIPSLSAGGIVKANATTGVLAIASASDLGTNLPAGQVAVGGGSGGLTYVSGFYYSSGLVVPATGTAISAPNGDISTGGEIVLTSSTSLSGPGSYTQDFVTTNAIQYYDGGGQFTLTAPSASGLAGKRFVICSRTAKIVGFPIGANAYYTNPGPLVPIGACIEMLSDGTKWMYTL